MMFRHRGLHLLVKATTVDPNTTNSTANVGSPYIGVVFLLLTALIIFAAIFYYYLRERCLVRRRRLFRQSATSTNRVRQEHSGGGLDYAVVTAFPVLTYSEAKAKAKCVSVGPDCAVCLSAFEDQETLRLLPKCGHVFHPDCVGLWLADHTTCPCCRADLLLKELPSNDVVADVGTLGVNGGGGCI